MRFPNLRTSRLELRQFETTDWRSVYAYTADPIVMTYIPEGTFTEAQATSTLSDPTQGNAWFRTTVDPDFPNATRFVGDYSGVAAVGDDVVVSWTDLRDQVCLFGECAAGQSQFLARMP